MNVRLISITQAAEGDMRDAEGLIAYCARVSSPHQESLEIEKLLTYLIDNAHWSPFEMVDMTVEIVTSRAISPQILRHRSFSFQEFSQRYAAVTKFEPVELRMQGNTKQGSADSIPQHLMSLNDKVNWATNYAEQVYAELLQHGVSRECARMVLPLCTQTKLYMKGSLRSWIHYLDVRCESNTQKEHRDIAEAIKAIFIEQFPTISKACGYV